MTELLPSLNHFELQQNPLFAQTWVKAADEWWRRGPPVTPLSPAQAIALMTYTMKDVYKEFNAAVHVAGRSHQEYRDNFHFKTLHFLLTNALVTLRDNWGPRCHHVFQGVRGIRFKARRGDTIRFGQFTSTSLHKQIAQQFGTDMMFQVQSCYGVDIQKFSSNPSEKEVLIPPFETFEVTSVTQEGDRALIQLRSSGTFSRYSCEWLRRDIMGKTWKTGIHTADQLSGDQPCELVVAQGVLVIMAAKVALVVIVTIVAREAVVAAVATLPQWPQLPHGGNSCQGVPSGSSGLGSPGGLVSLGVLVVLVIVVATVTTVTLVSLHDPQ
ncbi:erythroblast NAD(P)(+)--arginine ADP-ribosyltransferase-like [Ammospiza maritima maritima]